MRVREIDTGAESFSSEIHWYSYNTPYHVNLGSYGFNYRRKYETMSDLPGKFYVKYSDGRRVLAFKPVRHVVWGFTPSLETPLAWITGASWSTSNLYSQLKGWGLINPGVEVSSMIYDRLRPYIYTANYQHYERWIRSKPSVVSRANMTVFLYELRDIKRMFDLLPKKHFSLGNWRDVLKYANSQHLNWNFGWKPFLRDLKQVAKAYMGYSDRLLKVMKNVGKALTTHAVDELEISDTTTFVTCPDGWKADLIVSGKQTFHSTFDYSYTLPSYTDNELFLRSFLDTVGLNISPANIWRVLPFSFVVDWFIGLGGFLDQYTTDWIQPWICFNQACSSVRGEIECLVRRTSPAGTPTVSYFGNFKLRIYDRFPGIPQFTLDQGSLTADKIRLMASLGLSLFYGKS